MTGIKDKFLEFCAKRNFSVKYLEIDELSDQVLSIKKWNWEYLNSLECQNHAVDFIKQNRALKIYIFCNHPCLFTVGRGLQKGKSSSFSNLVEFDPKKVSSVFPIFNIKRGGGITFHYPGQWIFYPIVALGQSVSLKNLIRKMLMLTKEILESEFGIYGIDINRNFLGLWSNEHKLASVGIGTDRFVTFHGMALNLLRDQKMFTELMKINPCGLNGEIYKCVDDLVEVENNLLEKFHQKFIQRIK